MEHLYIKDTLTGRSLWLTQIEDGYTMLTDGMVNREPAKAIHRTIKDWMRGVKPLSQKVKKEVEFMELYEYEGEPTEQEIRQRLEFWVSWSPNAYKDNHLRIHSVCPCCGSDEDTEWVRQEWNICYDCLIAFTLDDLLPTYDPNNVLLEPYEEE